MWSPQRIAWRTYQLIDYVVLTDLVTFHQFYICSFPSSPDPKPYDLEVCLLYFTLLLFGPGMLNSKLRPFVVLNRHTSRHLSWQHQEGVGLVVNNLLVIFHRNANKLFPRRRATDGLFSTLFCTLQHILCYAGRSTDTIQLMWTCLKKWMLPTWLTIES